MKAAEIMTADVITIRPEASVLDAAALMLEHRISGAPVVDAEGKLVGIVSEGDLLRRVEAGTTRRRAWWLEIFTRTETLAAEYVKAHGRKVSDVMTRAVISVTEDTPLATVTDLLEQHGIKRVPVLRDGKLAGIISRADLLRAIARCRPVTPVGKVDDQTIREDVLRKLEQAPWSRPWNLNVLVQDGVVDLWGMVATEEERAAIRVAVETTHGVKAVNDNLLLQNVVSGV